MDSVTLVTAALAAGAGAGLKDAAATAATDSYQALKALVLARVRDVDGGTDIIERHEKDPETWRAPVEKELREANVAADPVVTLQASDVLMKAAAIGIRISTITASGERSVAAWEIQGDVHTGDG